MSKGSDGRRLNGRDASSLEPAWQLLFVVCYKKNIFFSHREKRCQTFVEEPSVRGSASVSQRSMGI